MVDTELLIRSDGLSNITFKPADADIDAGDIVVDSSVVTAIEATASLPTCSMVSFLHNKDVVEVLPTSNAHRRTHCPAFFNLIISASICFHKSCGPSIHTHQI